LSFTTRTFLKALCASLALRDYTEAIGRYRVVLTTRGARSFPILYPLRGGKETPPYLEWFCVPPEFGEGNCSKRVWIIIELVAEVGVLPPIKLLSNNYHITAHIIMLLITFDCYFLHQLLAEHTDVWQCVRLRIAGNG